MSSAPIAVLKIVRRRIGLVVAASIAMSVAALLTGAPARAQRIIAAGNRFVTASGAPFTPRGANYVRLDSTDTHITLDPAQYSPALAEAAFTAMQAGGYNLVRLTLNSPTWQQGFGLTFPGIPGAQLRVIGDALARAAAHKLHVMLTMAWLPPNYAPLYGAIPVANVSGISAEYLFPSFAIARAAAWVAVLQGVRQMYGPNILAGIMAIDVYNEAAVNTTDAPWAATSGTFPFQGKAYDLSNAAQRQALLDAASSVWFNVIATSIRAAVAPAPLLTASLFSPLETGFPGFNGVTGAGTAQHYPLRAAALAAAGADFIEFHEYNFSGPGWDYAASFASAQLTPGLGKPMLLSEFGAMPLIYGSVAAAGADMAREMRTSCGFGFSGWALWTWNTTNEVPAFYTLASDLGPYLSPAALPAPCG